MRSLNSPLRITTIIFVLAGYVNAQDGGSTTVTLPGGMTISTTSLIVGTLAVVVVAVVGVVFAARRSHSGHTTNTIFQNVSDSTFGDIKSETRVASHENGNPPGTQSTRNASALDERLRAVAAEQREFNLFAERLGRAQQEPANRDEIKRHIHERDLQR